MIVNKGLIEGQVELAAGADYVNNYYGRIDQVQLKGGKDVYFGSATAIDVAFGGAGDDDLRGYGGADVLNGGENNDTIAGGLGNDTLTGGSGIDRFVFNTPLSSTLNKDVIVDFSVVDDYVVLDDVVFNKIIQATSATGVTMLSKYFAANASGVATTLDHRIIYETDTGLLRYDADGNKAGGTAGIVFADLAGGLAMTSADFLII